MKHEILMNFILLGCMVPKYFKVVGVPAAFKFSNVKARYFVYLDTHLATIIQSARSKWKAE